MSIVGLDHVQVAAPPGCEADARRFYGDLLGLAELERPAALAARGGAWFALGSGQQVHVGVEGAVGELRPHLELRALVAGPDGAACELRETYHHDGVAREAAIAAFYAVADARIVRARVYRAGSADL